MTFRVAPPSSCLPLRARPLHTSTLTQFSHTRTALGPAASTPPLPRGAMMEAAKTKGPFRHNAICTALR